MLRSLTVATRLALRRQPVWALAARGFSLPAHEVTGLPALSPTMESGTIASWSVEEGGEIAAGDVICEVETDKATVAFEAQDDAVLAKILVQAGAGEVKVGDPICVLVESVDDVAAFKDFEAPAAASAPPPAAKEEPPKKEEPTASSPPPPPPREEVKPAPSSFAPAAQSPPQSSGAPAEASGASGSDFVGVTWGEGPRKSALAAAMAASQSEYEEAYGATGLKGN